MSFFRNCTALYLFLIASTFAFCQQEPMPQKLDSETIKFLQQQEKLMMDSIEESKKHPGPKFSVFQCRADAQTWTIDPFDNKDGRNLFVNTAILVNGQFRSLSSITSHVTVTGLRERVYEMEVCRKEDAGFEKQYSTYSSISKSYSEEITFRYSYFLIRHNLEHQFFEEDAKDNK